MWAFLFSVFKIVFKLCKCLLNTGAFEKWPHIQYQIAVRPPFLTYFIGISKADEIWEKEELILQIQNFYRSEFSKELSLPISPWSSWFFVTCCRSSCMFLGDPVLEQNYFCAFGVLPSFNGRIYFMVDWLFYYLKCVLQINLICPVP